MLLRGQWAAAVAAVLEAQPSANLPISHAFAQHLCEVSWNWATGALAPDLEAFARHSNRAQVGTADVILAGRKNDVTLALLRLAAEKRTVKQKTGGDKHF